MKAQRGSDSPVDHQRVAETGVCHIVSDLPVFTVGLPAGDNFACPLLGLNSIL